MTTYVYNKILDHTQMSFLLQKGLKGPDYNIASGETDSITCTLWIIF